MQLIRSCVKFEAA